MYEGDILIPFEDPAGGDEPEPFESKGDQKSEAKTANTSALNGALMSAEPAAPQVGSRAELEPLLRALTEAASGAARAWLSYLAVLMYLFIAVAAVTHRALLYEAPVRLPFLGVDLPFNGFAEWAPAMFLVMHIYVLVQMGILGGKVREFEQALQAPGVSPGTAARERKLLPANLFVQWLAGPPEVRRGLMGQLLRAIPWLTLIISPILLLAFFQLQFLPYHSVTITWWQRILVFLDIVFLWALYGKLADRTPLGRLQRFRDRTLRVAGAVVLSLSIIVLSMFVVTFPGEWMHEHLASRNPIRSLHDHLLVGQVDWVSHHSTTLFSDHLVLPGLDVIDHQRYDTEAKIDSIPKSISLECRDLRGAVFAFAILRSVDFRGADLRNADFFRADLRRAQLQSISKIKGEKAFDITHLDESSMVEADLRGASLSWASLRWAHLERAKLAGADLAYAKLQGADLEEARMDGASLWAAHLEFAQLNRSRLPAARLGGALFAAAELEDADLTGAFGANTDLQAAKVKGAKFQSAVLKGLRIWRADDILGSSASQWGGGLICNPRTSPEFGPLEKDRTKVLDYAAFRQELIAGALDGVETSRRRKTVEDGLDRLKPSPAPTTAENMAQAAWNRFAKRTPDRIGEEQVEAWALTACAEEDAPYNLEGVIALMKQQDTKNEVPIKLGEATRAQLAGILLDEKRCYASRKLTEADAAALRKFLIHTSVPLPPVSIRK